MGETIIRYRDPDLNGDKWLFQQIDEYKNQCQQNNSMVNIPLKKDGNAYCYSDLNHEQKPIAFMVMNKIIEWIEYKNLEKKHYTFKPLRMTVSGKAGTGKSFLIKTIIAMVRKLTNCNESVIICGPTGKLCFFITEFVFLSWSTLINLPFSLCLFRSICI